MNQSMPTITIVEYYGEINAEFGVVAFGKMPALLPSVKFCLLN